VVLRFRDKAPLRDVEAGEERSPDSWAQGRREVFEGICFEVLPPLRALLRKSGSGFGPAHRFSFEGRDNGDGKLRGITKPEWGSRRGNIFQGVLFVADARSTRESALAKG
jgi:hypothetical protein